MSNIEIELIISQLLEDKECVVLPNFGGFIVRESPANFNESTQKIKPFSKTLFFNQHLKDNDGILISSIQKQILSTYDQAQLVYNQWLEQLKAELNTNHQFVLGKIGVMYLKNENDIWFETTEHLNLALESYGLYPIHLNKLTIENKAEVPVYNINEWIDQKPIESTEVQFKIKRKAWFVAASIALVAHLGYMFLEKTDVSLQTANLIPEINVSVEKENNQPIESNINLEKENLLKEELKEDITRTEQTTETPTKEPILEVKESEPIQVQEQVVEQKVQETSQEVEAIFQSVAKYRIEKNAIFHESDLKKQGFKVQIVQKDQWFYVQKK